MQPYIISLEGGGTRSQAAVLSLDGQVLQVVNAGDVNTNFTTTRHAQESVLHAVNTALTQAGVSGEQVLYFATSLVAAHFGAETFGELCPNACYHYYGERDVVFARAGIFRPHGIALVAGTGATAFAQRSDDGRKVSLGGWGALLGDEGSAYHLGWLGLRAAVLAYEERGEPTRLFEALCQHFNLSRENFQHEMIWLAYQKPLSRVEVAGVAALVTRLAKEGDAVCLRLTEQVVEDLGSLMLHAARRLFRPEEAFHVAIAGGLVNAGELLLAPLRTRLTAAYPRATLLVGLEEPAVALGRLEVYRIAQQETSC